MKKILLSAAFAFAILSSTDVLAQQGFGTNEPDKSAVVDIVSTQRGLLIPRISIPDLDAAAPVNNPATSLFVYNTNTTSGEGFYYWDGAKWVRFVSGNTEQTVVVAAGENVKVDPNVVDNTTTYTVGVKGGTNDGQVLVTKIDNSGPDPVTTTEWVDPNDFVLDALTAGNAIGIDLDVNGDIEIKFNGTLTEDTTIATGTHDLAITGLEDISATFDADTHNIVVMGADGVLKITSPQSLIEDVIDNGDLEAKTLTGAGITVTAGTTAGDNTNVSVADVVLKDVTLGIADGAITNTKLAPGAVSQDKMTSFTDDNGTTNPVPVKYVPVADGAGNVTYQNVATAIGEDLTTDGKIVIGNSSSTVTSLTDAVLAATELSIAANSITSADIQNGTIQPVDIAAPGAPDLGEAGDENMVLVTDENGNVTWVEQSELANKDNYNFAAPLNKDAGTANTTGGLDYAVTIANANGTTVGVVREADTDPTVNVVDGVLSVNLTSTTLSGDVTGPLNATVVETIQGTDVSVTAPTAVNNVLVYNDTTGKWTPTELTGAHITGAAITSTSLDIPVNTAALTALNIEIAPGTDGQILTTVDNAGDLETEWATINSLIEVDNGLNKDNADVVELGGALIRSTTITASEDYMLAIAGLQNAPDANVNKAVVAEAGTGVLRTVDKVFTGTNVDVAANVGYSVHTPEVIINVTLGATDQDAVLPPASEAPGQVINFKIANTTDSHTGYLNLLGTYGSLPYQGWIVKSNGTEWVIVGRN